MRVLAAAALAFCACSDPTLSVQIDIPDPYRAHVTSVSLADYELDGLRCDAIAFGDEPPETLDGALTTQVVVTPGASAGLTGVSRLDHKVLIARGLDAGGELVVAGCLELDAVDGDVAVSITTEPAALPTIDARRPDAPFDPTMPLAIHVLDPLGKPLDQRAIVWRVFGPKGKPGGLPGKASCPRANVDDCAVTHAGDAALAIAPPALPGPALAQIHVEWARAQPALVAGFSPPASATFVLRSLLKAVPSPSCVAYRAATGVRIACLAVQVGGAIEVQHFAWNGTAMAKLPGAPSAPNAFALVTAPGGATDQLIALTTGGDFLDGTTGATLGHANFASTPVAAQLVPACGKTAFVVVGFTDGTVRSYGTDGSDLSTFASSPPSRMFALSATGCISDLASATTTYRGIVMTETKAGGTTVPFMQVDCPSGTCLPTWLGVGGVGFVAGADGSARLAAGRLDLSGVIIDESVIDPTRTEPAQELASQGTHDSISIPTAIVGGDFDDDGAPDRAWLLVAGGLRPPGRLQVELAANVNGTPIAGVSPELGANPTGLVVAKLDDDMTDDVALFSDEQVTIVLTGRAP